MNTIVTSREAILAAGKEIMIESGVERLSIRDVAQKCGISVGSVYNYFPSKSDLVVSTIESVWIEIIMEPGDDSAGVSFNEHLRALFNRIQKGCLKYPSFFSVHSLNAAQFDKTKGREVMQRYFSHMKKGLFDSLEQDPLVKKGVFTSQFTENDFIEFVFTNLMTLFMKRVSSCDTLCEIVKRIIY